MDTPRNALTMMFKRMYLEHRLMVSSDFVPGKKPDDCPAGHAVNKSLDQLALDDPAFRDPGFACKRNLSSPLREARRRLAPGQT